MTVRELIEELEEYPMDLPVVTDYHEVESISYNESFYFLDNSGNKYYACPAVVLE